MIGAQRAYGDFVPNNAIKLRQCNFRATRGINSLPSRSRNKAPDLRPAFIVLVEPYHGQPELVWHSYQRVGRHFDPLAVKPHSIFSTFRIPIHILDALAIGD